MSLLSLLRKTPKDINVQKLAQVLDDITRAAIKQTPEHSAEAERLLPWYTMSDLEDAIYDVILSKRQRRLIDFINPETPVTERFKTRPVTLSWITQPIYLSWLRQPSYRAYMANMPPAPQDPPPRLAEDVLHILRTLQPDIKTRTVYDIPKELYDAYTTGRLSARVKQRVDAFREASRVLGVLPESSGDRELLGAYLSAIYGSSRTPTPVDKRIYNIHLQPVVDRLLQKYAKDAPQYWEMAKSQILENQRKKLADIEKALLSEDVPILSLLTAPPVQRPMQRLETLLSSVNVPSAKIPSVLAHVKSLPTHELTPTGRLSTRGSLLLHKEFEELQKRVADAISRQIDQAAAKFYAEATEPPSEFSDAVSRILRDLPSDKPANWKTIKQLYPSEAARFSADLQAILRASGDDLRKAADNMFAQLPVMKGNPKLRAVWTSPKTVLETTPVPTGASPPEHLLIVGDPKTIYPAMQDSKTVARMYSNALRTHKQYVGDTGPLPVVGWVRLSRYYNDKTGKPEWLIKEVQSDLLPAISKRLNALKRHKLVWDYYRSLDPKLPVVDRKRQTRQWLRSQAESETLPQETRDLFKSIFEGRIAPYLSHPPSAKEEAALKDLQSAIKDWQNAALAEVMEQARQQGIDRVRMFTPDWFSDPSDPSGIRSTAKRDILYEDLPKRFKFSRTKLTSEGVPLPIKSTDEIWTRVPVILPPGMLLSEFLTE